MRTQKIEISRKTIVFTVLFLISLFLLWKLRSILILVFICFVLMEAINPYVTKLEKRKIPRPLSILMIYLVILAIFSFAFAGLIPVIVDQTTALIKALPDIIQNINLFGVSAFDWSSQLKIIEGLPGNIAKTAVSIFSNIFSGLIILVITFYMLLERKNFEKYSLSLFGDKGKIKTIKIVESLEKRLGNWVNAQVLLMLAIGVLSYIGYLIIGLKYALPLAIIAGLLEIVPNIGPTISTIFAAVIGLTISPLTALLAVVWGILVQQLENHFIVPKIMKEAIGLNPLVTILLIASGASLGGIIGAILAIPIYLTVDVVFRILTEKQ